MSVCGVAANAGTERLWEEKPQLKEGVNQCGQKLDEMGGLDMLRSSLTGIFVPAV